jgi:hypothetical protein
MTSWCTDMDAGHTTTMPGWTDLFEAAQGQTAPAPADLAALAAAVAAREAHEPTQALAAFLDLWPHATARREPDLRLRPVAGPDWRAALAAGPVMTAPRAPVDPPALLSFAALEDIAARIGRASLPPLVLRQSSPTARIADLESAIARLDSFLDRELCRGEAA